MDSIPTTDPSAEIQSRLLELSLDLLATADPDGRLVSVNRAWGTALGVEPSELAGRPFGEFMTEADGAAGSELIERLAAGQRVSGVPCRMAGARAERLVLWSGYGDQDTGCLYLAGRDVTEHRGLEDELARRAEGLERVNAELQEFAYIASHDLAEPLRMVTSYLELLERRYADALDETAHEFIGFAVGGARRMRTLIDDLLTYSRVGSHELEHGPVDLAEVLGNVLLGLGPAIVEAGAEVTAPGTFVSARGDATQVGQLLQNLIANAVKFRAEGRAPEVTVTAVADGDGVRIDVADNGIGVDPNHAERIFKMFARLHGRDEYEGTGIGLAVCRRIADRHGGRIWVDSGMGEPDSGSTFHVWLPGRG